MSRRVAVVLLNLGGPDGPSDVRPFLRNLFRDPAIIAAPGPVRELLAWLISAMRAKSARANYALMGGGSPLLARTTRQAEALAGALKAARPEVEWRCLIGMRYWRPLIVDAAAETRAFGADAVVLLPLYPQFSTTTTGSSLTTWRKAAPDLPAHIPCCYPEAGDFIRAHAELIERTWREAGSPASVRVLFSAHGLPEAVIARGDPYVWQVERTVAAVAGLLPVGLGDHVVCYQSRVGPLKWVGPSTEHEIRRAGAEGKGALVSPIAFVSEHIETLVELDHDYAAVAREAGVTRYLRAPALGVEPAFIAALRDVALAALDGRIGINAPGGRRLCPAACGACPVE